MAIRRLLRIMVHGHPVFRRLAGLKILKKLVTEILYVI